MGMGNTGIPWVPWDSHENGSKVSHGMGRCETRDGTFFQRLSVLIQRFNVVLLHDCFVDDVAGYSSYFYSNRVHSVP